MNRSKARKKGTFLIFFYATLNKKKKRHKKKNKTKQKRRRKEFCDTKKKHNRKKTKTKIQATCRNFVTDNTLCRIFFFKKQFVFPVLSIVSAFVSTSFFIRNTSIFSRDPRHLLKIKIEICKKYFLDGEFV